jgi:hypothetical protein
MTRFDLVKMDDINYQYIPSAPLLLSTGLQNAIDIHILGLKQRFDYKYILSKEKSTNIIKIRLEFLNSFENKILSVRERSSFQAQAPSRLLQQNQSNDPGPSLIVDAYLNQVQDLNAEIKIDSVNTDNLWLDPTQNDNPFRIINAPQFIVTFLRFFIPFLLGLLGLSVFVLIISNFSVISSEYTRALKFWYMSLFRHTLLISTLSLVNKILPEPLEYFLIMLYSGIFGRDNFEINPSNSLNYTVNQPQYYRLLKTDSLFSNSPILLSIHFVFFIFLTIFSLAKNKPNLRNLSTKFFHFFSANVMFLLVFPFYLDILVNSLISLSHSHFTSASGMLDFLGSLTYFLSFFLGKF